MDSPNDKNVAEKIDMLFMDTGRLELAQKEARKLAKNYSIGTNADITLEVIEKIIHKIQQ